MNGSVFPEATLDRGRVHWEDYLNVLTPVEERSPGRWFKREDHFAPLGEGGINGAKLRQCLHLFDTYARDSEGILTGASVLSPQVSMSALIARHYGLPCTVVLGATKPSTCLRHENVAIAHEAGAEFLFTPVGFNPALQAEVERIHAAERPGWYRLCYGITTPSNATDAEVAAFHAVGARQAENVPEGVRTLVMTAGSCNSCVSVLYGLALHPPKDLERVVLLGVGPTRLDWIERRLAQIENATGTDVASLFRRRYHHHPATQDEFQTDGGLVLEHWDLHSTGYATYHDRMPYALDGIEFHPTYEGKALAYMAEHRAAFHWFWEPEGVLFWIVGSAPSRRAMQDAFLVDGLGSYAAP